MSEPKATERYFAGTKRVLKSGVWPFGRNRLLEAVHSGELPARVAGKTFIFAERDLRQYMARFPRYDPKGLPARRLPIAD